MKKYKKKYGDNIFVFMSLAGKYDSVNHHAM